MGVKGVAIHDPTPASWADLASNFYLSEADAEAGTPRASACLLKLAELNSSVRVRLHTGSLGATDVSRFAVRTRDSPGAWGAQDPPDRGFLCRLRQGKGLVWLGTTHSPSPLAPPARKLGLD